MNERERIYVVDRFEADVAVLVPDDPAAADATVSRCRLPGSVAGGDVLRVPVRADGTPDWEAATIDAELREQRLAEARERLERLKKRDPGGDIVL